MKGEVDRMEESMPLGFRFALAQNPEAMKKFSSLSQEQQSELIQKARAVSSKREMQALVHSLSVQ